MRLRDACWRIFGYIVAAPAATTTYVICICAATWFLVPLPKPPDAEAVRFAIGILAFFWLVVLVLGIILMSLPWFLIIWSSYRYGYTSPVYFVLCGAIAAFLVGCFFAPFVPKPLFIEDQTYLEAFVIAARRQGLYLLLSGFVGGLTYWFVSERKSGVTPPAEHSSATGVSTR